MRKTLKDEYYEILDLYDLPLPLATDEAYKRLKIIYENLITKQDSYKKFWYQYDDERRVDSCLKEIAENGFIWNRRLREIASKGEKVLREHYSKLICSENEVSDYFIGEFPHFSLNAYAKQTELGYLILINSGTFDFLYRISIIFGRDIRKNKTEKEISEYLSNYLWDFIKYPPTLGSTLIIDENHRHLDFYEPSQADSNLAINLSNLIIEFIVYHELAHIYLGHLKSNSTQEMISRNLKKSSNFICLNQKEEFEADALAFSILVDINIPIAQEMDKKTPGSGQLHWMLCLAAPNLFFEISSILSVVIDFVYDGEYRRLRDTHPPLIRRGHRTLEQAAFYFQGDLNENYFLLPLIEYLSDLKKNIQLEDYFSVYELDPEKYKTRTSFDELIKIYSDYQNKKQNANNI